MASAHPPKAAERVLSTLNEDGTRRWLRPRPSSGRFQRRRLVVAWFLMVLFVALPYIRIDGKPAVLLDIARRRFTLFGATFLPTDTLLLMLLLVGIFVGIFLLTAILGRVWCGWACPQTVYLEFLFRPIERLLEGSRGRQLQLDREGADLRRVLKYPVFLLLSMLVAHTFLAYFVGVETLLRWVTRPPWEHPAAFLVMAGTTALMFFDFAYFREQTCILVCPYGRFQSVLLDRQSMIVGYDTGRGEPRAALGKRKREAAGEWGDCVDCGACVTTCPTGIDIREGLQMECVACTQCIDACDHVMDRQGKPRGLIRYTSQEELATGKRKILRPRVVAYPLILAVVFTLLGFKVADTASADVTVLRGIGSPFTRLATGEISNQLRVKIQNRGERERLFLIELVELGEGRIVAPANPLPVPAGRAETATLFIMTPPDVFVGGKRSISLRVSDEEGFSETIPYRLLGPFAGAGSSPTAAGETGP